MEGRTQNNLTEFQSIIRKMPLQVCCTSVLPEIGVRWRDVATAIRNARLPMTSASVGTVLKKHVARAYSSEEIDDIVGQMRIKLIAYSPLRVWHAVELLEPHRDLEPVPTWTKMLGNRVTQAARRTIRAHNTHVEVHTSKCGDFLFLSVQQVSSTRVGSPIYVACVYGQPVAFATALSPVIQAVVVGLGYKKYRDANLYGKDLMSLMRIMNKNSNTNINLISEMPIYRPLPLVTKNGIDFTSTKYDQSYVESLIGPDPPLITNLDIKSEKTFFDNSRLNINMSVAMSIKSENVASTLKSWVAIKGIPATSEFVKIFHRIKSNRINLNDDNFD